MTLLFAIVGRTNKYVAAAAGSCFPSSPCLSALPLPPPSLRQQEHQHQWNYHPRFVKNGIMFYSKSTNNDNSKKTNLRRGNRQATNSLTRKDTGVWNNDKKKNAEFKIEKISNFTSDTTKPRRRRDAKGKPRSKTSFRAGTIDDASNTLTPDPVKSQGTDTTISSSKQHRFKGPRRKEWLQRKKPHRRGELQIPVLTASKYYVLQRQMESSNDNDDNSFNTLDVSGQVPRRKRKKHIFTANASAVLDPKLYCRASANSSSGSAGITHGISRSISGTDAARRLLRGKKEFVRAIRSHLAKLEEEEASGRDRRNWKHRRKNDGDRDKDARNGNTNDSAKGNSDYNLQRFSLSVNSGVVLQGHGIPSQLLQHFIDIGDALLTDAGNASEFSFNNFDAFDQSSLTKPSHSPGSQRRQRERQGILKNVRIRTQDTTNQTASWSAHTSTTCSSSTSIEWDYHLLLYLTAMKRMAHQLGLVLKPEPNTRKTRSAQHWPTLDGNSKSNDNNYSDANDSSFILLPPPILPHWKVEVLRGSLYDLHTLDDEEGKAVTTPVPIVEWIRGSSPADIGHVVIRLQGSASDDKNQFVPPNIKTSPTERGPVTLVFDANFGGDSV